MPQKTVLRTERERVIEAVTAMFIHTDRRDWDQVRARFTGSVFFDMSSLTGVAPGGVTAESIVDGWATGLDALKAIHHQLGNFQVIFTGNGAGVRCYGIAYHYLPNKTGLNTRVFVGSYDIQLVNRPDGWKIAALRYNSKFVEGNKDLENS